MVLTGLAVRPPWSARLYVHLCAARHDGTIGEVSDGDWARLVELFETQGTSLVRLARLFVDDRNAAEDLVQEAFIRLSRSFQRIEDQGRTAPYLRSIVLNLARDHNRRGLVSLRHRAPADDIVSTAEDEVVIAEEHREVLAAVRALPRRQRDCVVLRYYLELGIAEIAETLELSPNSVKTHLKRGLVSLGGALGEGSEGDRTGADVP
jgi:RNA polymerase sigma factor (sigma-70 family)